MQRSAEERDIDNDSDDGEPRRGGGGDDDEKPKDNEIERPAGVSDGDWRLYRCISLIQETFHDQFKEIFA